jgi:hypothetical protein
VIENTATGGNQVSQFPDVFELSSHRLAALVGGEFGQLREESEDAINSIMSSYGLSFQVGCTDMVEEMIEIALALRR